MKFFIFNSINLKIFQILIKNINDSNDHINDTHIITNSQIQCLSSTVYCWLINHQKFKTIYLIVNKPIETQWFPLCDSLHNCSQQRQSASADNLQDFYHFDRFLIYLTFNNMLMYINLKDYLKNYITSAVIHICSDILYFSIMQNRVVSRVPAIIRIIDLPRSGFQSTI